MLGWLGTSRGTLRQCINPLRSIDFRGNTSPLHGTDISTNSCLLLVVSRDRNLLPPLFKRWAILVILDFVVEKSGLGGHQCTLALSRRDVLTQSFACTLARFGASKDELVICQVAIVLLMVQTSGVHQLLSLLVEKLQYFQDFDTSKRFLIAGFLKHQ